MNLRRWLTKWAVKLLTWVERRGRKCPKWGIKLLCRKEGHNWIQRGTKGRACPYSTPTSGCTQPVFQCGRCDTFDYGEKDGPGWDSCKGCDLRKEI